jgi:hypothetical protein
VPADQAPTVEPSPLSEAEQEELRRLRLTETERRRQRTDQWFPPTAQLPNPDHVADLVAGLEAAAAQATGTPHRPLDLIPHLLEQLPPQRAERLVSAAGACRDALRAMAGAGISSWASPLLARLIFGMARADFDALLPAAAEVGRAADALHGAAYRMVLVGPPPPDAVERLAAYIGYLENGGNPRRFPAAPQQRAAGTVLRQLGLNGAARADIGALRQAMTFLQLTASTRDVVELCGRLRVPEPKTTPAAVARRLRELQRVDHAARAVEALRREVLFIHPSSPIPVPNMDAVTAVTAAVLLAAETVPRNRAALAAMADALTAPPGTHAAPEVAELATAVRTGNLAAVENALDRLTDAGRELADQLRLVELEDRLDAPAEQPADANPTDGADTSTEAEVAPSPAEPITSTGAPVDELDEVRAAAVAAAVTAMPRQRSSPTDPADARASPSEPAQTTASERLAVQAAGS